MLILNRDDVRQSLPMAQTIRAMKHAYAALSNSQAVVPVRARLDIPGATGLYMPAFVQGEAGKSLVVKVVNLFPANLSAGLPLIHAAVLVMDPKTGEFLALLEGGTLTAIRTGAGSGAATDLLARDDSHVAAIIGCGVQGRTQLEAICAVRPIEQVWVYGLTAANIRRFIEEMAGQHGIPDDIRAASSAAEAVRDADIICTATTSEVPVFEDSDLKPGAHINGVGSYTPQMAEVPPETVARAYVVVDSTEAAMEEAGELIQAIGDGIIAESHIQTEIGDIVLGNRPARTSREQITFFKSVGVAVQDAGAAQLALAEAQRKGLGESAKW